MSRENVLRPVDVNSQSASKSPPKKRTRYESPAKDKFVISSNSLLDDIKDSGLSLIESDSENEVALSDSENLPGDTSPIASSSKQQGRDLYEKDETKLLEISLLQASLSKETLKKLTLGEWNKFLIRTEEPEPETYNYFEILSDEMVLHIFQFLPKIVLPKIALVCRRWNRLAQDESLWARMDLSNRIVSPGAMGHVLGRQVVLLKLSQSEIGHPPYFPNSKVYDPLFKARTLYLDMSMVHCTPETLAMIFSKCYRLKKVSLENVKVNSTALIYLARNTDLEVLNLAMVQGITLEGAKHLLTNCRNLQQLNLGWTSLNSGTITYICQNLPDALDRLNLSGCRKSISDKNVADLVKSCPNLRELDLSDCTGLSGESVSHILKLESLNFLALSRCYLISYRALLILKRLNSLMFLDVHGNYMDPADMRILQDTLTPKVTINKFKFSSVARPTVGARHSHIWNMRIKDNV